MTRDRRQAVLEAAVFNPDLSYAERCLMVVVVTVKAETVDGERRHGSKGMQPDGTFSLHLDYLAGALASSPEGVRKLLRSLRRKEVLVHRFEGTFGRPTTWQAQVVRGAKNGTLTSGRKGTPYGLAGWVTRGAEKAPLTYKTPLVGAPDGPDASHRESVVGQTNAARDEQVVGRRHLPANSCLSHPWQTCPPDCRNAAQVETDRRKGA